MSEVKRTKQWLKEKHTELSQESDRVTLMTYKPEGYLYVVLFALINQDMKYEVWTYKKTEGKCIEEKFYHEENAIEAYYKPQKVNELKKQGMLYE